MFTILTSSEVGLGILPSMNPIFVLEGESHGHRSAPRGVVVSIEKLRNDYRFRIVVVVVMQIDRFCVGSSNCGIRGVFATSEPFAIFELI